MSEMEKAASNDADADIASRLLNNLRTAIGVESASAVAARSGLQRPRVQEILRGAYPDGFELSRLEQAYGRLWPGREKAGG